MDSFEAIILSSEEQKVEDQKAKDLIQHLLRQTEHENGSKNNHVKKIENTIFGTDISILSWRFNEWDYYSKKITLPTNARGLFTTDDGVIICRGYDKFFNLNEMSSVKEATLQAETKGPYTVTVKSNGCIVFISGLENGTLVVCSKHSTGDRTDLTRNHAMVAQNVLETQLKQYNINSSDLGKFLFKNKITAVCEYCDDDFEEHVLEYKNNKAGLYLHGLNLNNVDFVTYPMNKVNEFGKIFGFKETKYVQFDTFDETLSFMKEANKTGTFEGEEIEGFVVRCFKTDETGKKHDFFFKYKFEEPYLLYRELREITKQFINDGPENLKFGKHKLICMDYIKFIMPYLVSNQQLKVDYLENKGIIELRKKYFESKSTSSMQMITEELNMIDLAEEMKKLKFGETKSNRYVIVTVATIGCGKTTTSVGLSYLYPELISHIQNDNIQTPGKDKLVLAALDALEKKPLVILDKNNHKLVERKQLFDGFNRLNETIPKSKLKFVCLNFINNRPKDDYLLREITRERVISRGDDHQSIKVIKDGVKNAEGIMNGFINRFELLRPDIEPDANFDYIIDLDVHEKDSSLLNMKKVVSSLKKFIKDIELRQPTEEEFNAAFEKAKAYKPTFSKKMKPYKCKPSYFGILIKDDSFLPFVESNNIDFYAKLKQTNRVQKDFHVTLVHSSMRRSDNENRLIWDTYMKILKLQPEVAKGASEKNKFLFSSDYSADIALKKIVWNTQVMCIEVEIVQILHKGEKIALPCGNKYAHITIGTIDKAFPAVLAGKMLETLYSTDIGNDAGKTSSINVVDLKEKKILTGLPLYAFLN